MKETGKEKDGGRPRRIEGERHKERKQRERQRKKEIGERDRERESGNETWLALVYKPHSKMELLFLRLGSKFFSNPHT